MASRTLTKDIITLKGSAAIVSEFFGYAANSILYNRGVYPEESFVKVKKYGLSMLLTQDEGVKSFIASITSQLSGSNSSSFFLLLLLIYFFFFFLSAFRLLSLWLVGWLVLVVVCLRKEWLEAGKLQRIVLVIMGKASSEVLERWNFNIQTDAQVVETGVSREKSDKEIMREIQAIMRQIASCITYLPCLDEECVFDVLAYTDTDAAVPFAWMESDAKLINNPQMVKLHSFDTKIHKVDTMVSYRNDEWEDE